MGGLTLAGLLRAEDAAGIGSSTRSVINIHLDGGAPQMDTIDLKPDAPAEIRGEFSPIPTSVPGIQICELLPKVASIAERFTFIRSLVDSAGRHDGFQCQSGYDRKDLESLGGRPAMGSVIAKLQGSPTDIAPPFVDLMLGRPLVRNSARPGILGPAFKPFRPDLSKMFQRELEPGMMNELRQLGGDHSVSLSLNEDLSVDRLNDRRSLLAGLDRVKRRIDGSGMMDAMDRFTQQATGILTSGRFRRRHGLCPGKIRERSSATPLPSTSINSRTTQRKAPTRRASSCWLVAAWKRASACVAFHSAISIRIQPTSNACASFCQFSITVCTL